MLALTIIFALCTLSTVASLGDIPENSIFAVIFGILTIVFFLKYKRKKQCPKTVEKFKSSPKTSFVNPYVDEDEIDRTGEFKIIEYPGLIKKKDEVVYFATPAKLLETKERVVGYQGGSAGASVRIAKGLTVRTGSSKGTPIRGKVEQFYDGDFIVTNKRVLFISSEKSFDIPIQKITAIQPIYSDAFSITYGSNTKNLVFTEDRLKLIYNVTTSVIEVYNE